MRFLLACSKANWRRYTTWAPILLRLSTKLISFSHLPKCNWCPSSSAITLECATVRKLPCRSSYLQMIGSYLWASDGRIVRALRLVIVSSQCFQINSAIDPSWELLFCWPLSSTIIFIHMRDDCLRTANRFERRESFLEASILEPWDRHYDLWPSAHGCCDDLMMIKPEARTNYSLDDDERVGEAEHHCLDAETRHGDLFKFKSFEYCLSDIVYFFVLTKRQNTVCSRRS
jgi:hypothetical protein